MRLDPLTLRRYPHIPVIREYKLEGPPWKKPNQFAEYVFTTGLMYDAPVQPVPRCNDRLDDDADVPHLTIGWVDGTPGIFRIGEGVNESGVGHAADAVAGWGEG